MGLTEIKAFLSYLANERHVAGSTQNQAYYAIRFLYAEVLGIKLDDIENLAAKAPKHLPIVLSREETAKVLDHVEGEPFSLMAHLLYGAGLRLKECQQLRFKDVEFSSGIIVVRGGKGDKDRTVPLPHKLVKPLMDQMAIARRLYEIDIQRGMPAVAMPNALGVKYPNEGTEFGWFWVFPAENCSTDPETKIYRRHHIYESGIQRSIKAARNEAGVFEHVTPHTFRHCFATHLLQDGYSIRMVHELLGHEDVKTTMIYTHCMLPAGEAGVVSPLDKMFLADIIQS
jgi:integron integrase